MQWTEPAAMHPTANKQPCRPRTPQDDRQPANGVKSPSPTPSATHARGISGEGCQGQIVPRTKNRASAE